MTHCTPSNSNTEAADPFGGWAICKVARCDRVSHKSITLAEERKKTKTKKRSIFGFSGDPFSSTHLCPQSVKRGGKDVGGGKKSYMVFSPFLKNSVIREIIYTDALQNHRTRQLKHANFYATDEQWLINSHFPFLSLNKEGMALSKPLLLCHLGPLPEQGALEHLSNSTRLAKKKHTPKQVYTGCSHMQKEK